MVASDVDVLESLDCVTCGVPGEAVLLSPRRQAYAQITRWLPRLIVVCMRFDELEGYELLTMLAFNPDTRRIPIALLMIPDTHEDLGSRGRGSWWLDVPNTSAC